jgi:TRAP-type C4-dicarboxylate transport system permease small subunit
VNSAPHNAEERASALSTLPAPARFVEAILAQVERVFLFTSCSCIAIMLAINIANLIVRNFAGRGIIWVWPWTGVLLIWTVFLTFYVLYRRRLDITVEYFVDRMSANGRRAARILADVCGIVMMLVILIEAPQIISRQVGVMDFVGLERYALSIPLIASAFFIAIEMALDIVRTVVTPVPPPASTEAELPRWSL